MLIGRTDTPVPPVEGALGTDCGLHANANIAVVADDQIIGTATAILASGIAAAGASTAASVMQARAAGKAARVQEKAADEALTLQREQEAQRRKEWEAREARLQPYRDFSARGLTTMGQLLNVTGGPMAGRAPMGPSAPVARAPRPTRPVFDRGQPPASMAGRPLTTLGDLAAPMMDAAPPMAAGAPPIRDRRVLPFDPRRRRLTLGQMVA